MSELVTRTNVMLTGTALSLVLTGCGSGASETESTANRIEPTSSPATAATAEPRPETTNIFAGKVCDSLSLSPVVGADGQLGFCEEQQATGGADVLNSTKMLVATPGVWHLARQSRSAAYRLGLQRPLNRLQPIRSVQVQSGIKSNGLNSLPVTMLQLILSGTYKTTTLPLSNSRFQIHACPTVKASQLLVESFSPRLPLIA